jgi:hypothetical protein
MLKAARIGLYFGNFGHHTKEGHRGSMDFKSGSSSDLNKEF